MTKRSLSITAGINYLIIFFTAIFANFFVLDSIKADPVSMITNSEILVRIGAIAFLIAAFSDIVIAWALQYIYEKNILNTLSTYFRLIHAVVMGIAVFALVELVNLDTASEILSLVERFNIIWLIGLFFFGFHLILLARIAKKPKLITSFLLIAGVMYVIDTIAHFLLPNYNDYAEIFLAMVAIPSIFGEMAFGLWLLFKGGKKH